METLTRLVTESLARHGFDRPVDYRRLQWSHWFRCESHHSLLVVPSKPGVFALAEEVAQVCGASESRMRHPEQSEGSVNFKTRAVVDSREPKTETPRMLAVAKFFEDDDIAYVLDRMLSQENPMRARLASGHYFVRFVVIEDPSQRHSVCSALNQWIASSAEKTTGIGSHFATSLELTTGAQSNHVATAGSDMAHANRIPTQCDQVKTKTAPTLNSAVATTIHCSSSFPSGF